MDFSQLQIAVVEERDIFQELILRCLMKAGVPEDQVHYFNRRGDVNLGSGHPALEPDLFNQLGLLQTKTAQKHSFDVIFFGQESWNDSSFESFKEQAVASFTCDYEPFTVTYSPFASTSCSLTASEMVIPELLSGVDMTQCLAQALSWKGRQSLWASRLSTQEPMSGDTSPSDSVSFCESSISDDAPVLGLPATDMHVSEQNISIVLLETSEVFRYISLSRLSAVGDVHVVESPEQALDQLTKLQSEDLSLMLFVGELGPRSSHKTLMRMMNAFLRDGSLKKPPFMVSLSHNADALSLDTGSFNVILPSYLSNSDVANCLAMAHSRSR